MPAQAVVCNCPGGHITGGEGRAVSASSCLRKGGARPVFVVLSDPHPAMPASPHTSLAFIVSSVKWDDIATAPPPPCIAHSRLLKWYF